jgi:nucleoside-diphosphate-sugar epimerase
MSGEPEPYIQNTINGTINILRTAIAEHKIKRVVLTASSMGAVPWKTDVEYSFGTDSYNEDSIKRAYQLPFTGDKAFVVYGAAKALTEKAVFTWLAQEKPRFTYNAVLPAANFGVSASGPFSSTGGWAKSAAEGDFSIIQHVSPRKYLVIFSFPRSEAVARRFTLMHWNIEFFVDVNDNALLHVAALIHPDVQNERLFAFSEPYNWNTVLAILRKLYPQRTFPDDLPGLGKDLSHPPKDRAESLLKTLGAPGWKSLEQSLKEAFDTIYA